MTRQYAPVPTTVTTSTWGGWQAINLKCLGCKHHFLCGTASMCSCASRTLVRTEHGDECDSYCPREGAEMNGDRTADALVDYYRWKSAKGLTPEQHTQWNMGLHRLLDEKRQRITDLERLVRHMKYCMDSTYADYNVVCRHCDECPYDNDYGNCDFERRIAELDGGECKIMATSTDNLMYPDRMTKCYDLSCGHSVTLKGSEPPRVCPICEKKVK